MYTILIINTFFKIYTFLFSVLFVKIIMSHTDVSTLESHIHNSLHNQQKAGTRHATPVACRCCPKTCFNSEETPLSIAAIPTEKSKPPVWRWACSSGCLQGK